MSGDIFVSYLYSAYLVLSKWSRDLHMSDVHHGSSLDVLDLGGGIVLQGSGLGAWWGNNHMRPRLAIEFRPLHKTMYYVI